MKQIFFITYGGGHVKIIEPLAKKLIEDKEIKFQILALTSAYDSIIKNFPEGIVKKVSNYSFLFDKHIDEILKWGIEFVDDNYSENSTITKEETIFYIGLSFYDLVQRVGEEKARKLYKLKQRQAFLPITIMEKILTYEKSDVVVSTSSPRFEQASLIAGNNLGLQTIEILDLFGQLNPLPEAKHIVCMNSNVANTLKKRGLNDRIFYPFGQPALENSVLNILNINRNEICKKLNILNNNPILLYAAQPPLVIANDKFSTRSMIDYKIMNAYIFKFLKKLNKDYGINIILRLHPNENIEDYKTFFDQYPFVKHINNTLDLYESIAVSNLVVTHCSTVAVEAVLSKKYTFTYQNDFSHGYPFEEMTIPPFIHAKGIDELYDKISLVLNSRMQELPSFEPLFQFGSIEKTIKLIKEL